MASVDAYMDGVYCFRCGTKYPKRKGYYPASYGILYKGIGTLPYCRDCVDAIYESYYGVCQDQKIAVRQTCRKLDLYWSESRYSIAEKMSGQKSIMSTYLAKLAVSTYAGKSYDDTLIEEETLWRFPEVEERGIRITYPENNPADEDSVVSESTIPGEWVEYWGAGYTYSMYVELEQRRKYYMSKLQKDIQDLDIGSDVLIRQICNLEVSISRDSAAGKPIEKSVSALNTLLGSLNLKPAQQENKGLEADIVSTPMGVWLWRYENKRPLPEIDEELKDVNHLKKYIFTWMGHLCKMLGVKNGYTKMYEDEVERLRVERPEYDGDDDEALLCTAYSEGSNMNPKG